tara:strand:- start:353 stop:1687 length:1335 start_codon:yes stop_codon:yes gene_type:complete
MIDSLAKGLINDSIKNQKLDIHKRRQKWINKMLDYYEGENMAGYIANRFKIEAFKEVPPLFINFTHRFINKMARIYRTGAVRNVNNQYTSLTKFKNIKLKHIERVAKLLGTIACRIVYNPAKGRMDYHPIYFYHPFMSDDDPLNPIAIAYPIDNLVDDIGSTQKQTYMYLDDTRMIRYDGNGSVIEESEHNYGVIPVAFIHREPQIDSHFVAGATDIIQANEAVNILFTELCLGGRFQAFGQPVVTGVYQDSSVIRAGTDETIILPEGASFDIVSPKGDMRGLIEIIKTIMETTGANNHLHIDFNRSGGEVPSGIALVIRDLERREDYEDYVDLWEMYEHEIYDIERAIMSANNVSLPSELGLDFNEPEYPKSTQDEVMFNQFMLDNNLTSYSKLLKNYNNDLTDEQAKAIMEENISENTVIKRRLNEQGQSVIQRLRQRTETA